MSEVETPPPHNLDKPHGLVASINNNKNIKQIIKGKNYINEMEIICRPLRQLWHKTGESPFKSCKTDERKIWRINFEK